MPTAQPIARAVSASKPRDANRQDTCLCRILILESGQSHYNVYASSTLVVSTYSVCLIRLQLTFRLLISYCALTHIRSFRLPMQRTKCSRSLKIKIKIRKTKIAYFFYRCISAFPHSDRLIRSDKTTVNEMNGPLSHTCNTVCMTYCCPFLNNYYSQRFSVDL